MRREHTLGLDDLERAGRVCARLGGTGAGAGGDRADRPRGAIERTLTVRSERLFAFGVPVLRLLERRTCG
ncbi:MAG: hypothetical protein ACYCV6_12705 [Steroidobacteraceae bacterium]